ncbi:MAG TPA: hypothetical protein PKV72_02655, partial [Candidatus Peribacteria bacterium]|nr:hypothetical protein [Candidatus Peribacteria bacterium]
MRRNQIARGKVAVQSAMRYSNERADAILQDARFAGLRTRMVDLLVIERKTSLQIADEVLDQMELGEDVSINTASSIVRRVLQELVDDDTRAEVHSDLHANALQRRRNEVNAARDKWMREAGLKVWTDEQNIYFLQLVDRVDMRRGKFSDHKKIAVAMCNRFGEGSFDA